MKSSALVRNPAAGGPKAGATPPRNRTAPDRRPALPRSQDASVPRLRLHITADAGRQIRSGHPWVFAGSVRKQNRNGDSGELAVIYDRHNKFLGIGLFDPDSELRVRLLHAGKPETVDRDWWQSQLEQALARRRGLFDERTTGYRLINGESDGWPGLVLDRYDTTLVLKLYTAAWLPRLGEVTSLVGGGPLASCQRERPVAGTAIDLDSPYRSRPQDAGGTLLLRLSRNIQDIARTKFNLRDGDALIGQCPERCPIFLESGLRFEADVLRGQKTGFFLDQRENRRLVESLAGGR